MIYGLSRLRATRCAHLVNFTRRNLMLAAVDGDVEQHQSQFSAARDLAGFLHRNQLGCNVGTTRGDGPAVHYQRLIQAGAKQFAGLMHRRVHGVDHADH